MSFTGQSSCVVSNYYSIIIIFIIDRRMIKVGTHLFYYLVQNWLRVLSWQHPWVDLPGQEGRVGGHMKVRWVWGLESSALLRRGRGGGCRCTVACAATGGVAANDKTRFIKKNMFVAKKLKVASGMERYSFYSRRWLMGVKWQDFVYIRSKNCCKYFRNHKRNWAVLFEQSWHK